MRQSESIGVLLFSLVVTCMIGGMIFTLVCRLLSMPSIWTRVGY